MAEYVVDVTNAEVITGLSDISALWGLPVRERIVRCRDCEHYTEDEAEYYHYCGSWCEQVEPDGFCKWGVRSTDG